MQELIILVRILRPLCYMGVFSEDGFETYAATPITKALMVPAIGGGFKFMYVSVSHDNSMSISLSETGSMKRRQHVPTCQRSWQKLVSRTPKVAFFKAPLIRLWISFPG